MGRILFGSILADGMPFYNCTLGKKGCSRVIDDTYAILGRPATLSLLDDMKEIGFKTATTSGLSIAITDLRIPEKKPELIGKAQKMVDNVERAYNAGAITERERHNQLLDIWAHCREELTTELVSTLKNDRRNMETLLEVPTESKEGSPYLNPVYLMSVSGARGNVSQMQQLAGMRGLMAKPSGEIIETPIRANFREGLNVLEYFSSTHGARKGLADTALKTADSGYLTRKLYDVAQAVVVTEHDCKTKRGIPKRALYKGEEVDVPLREIILGRTSRQPVVNPMTDETIVKENQVITDEIARNLERLNIDAVQVRSPADMRHPQWHLRMLLRHGHVHGHGSRAGTRRGHHRGPVHRRTRNAVDHAYIPHRRHRLTRPGGNQLPRRPWRHSRPSRMPAGPGPRCRRRQPHRPQAKRRSRHFRCQGPRTREVQGSLRSRDPCRSRREGPQGPVAGRLGSAPDADPRRGIGLGALQGHRDRQDHPRGNGQGFRYEGTDRHRAHRRNAPADPRRGWLGKILDFHHLPAKARIEVKEGEVIVQGQMLARQPKDVAGSADITGGLPRVTEIFEARTPKDPAVMAKVSGNIELHDDLRKGKMTIRVITETGVEIDHHVQQGKHLLVHRGDFVEAGDPLTEGPLVPQEILEIRARKPSSTTCWTRCRMCTGPRACPSPTSTSRSSSRACSARRWSRSPATLACCPRRSWTATSSVAATRPSREAGPHQRCRRHRIWSSTTWSNGPPSRKPMPWPTPRVIQPGQDQEVPSRPSGQTLLLGITKASLQSESFLSGASFQETTKVLTEAALRGAVDELKGLKENVLLGHLIPAGTGFDEYTSMRVNRLAEPPSSEEEDEASMLAEAVETAEALGADPIVIEPQLVEIPAGNSDLEPESLEALIDPPEGLSEI